MKTLREVLYARRPDLNPDFFGFKTSDESLHLKIVEQLEALWVEYNKVSTELDRIKYELNL